MDFDFLALARFDVTFDVTLRDDSSFSKLTNSCNFKNVSFSLLLVKANLKKSTCGYPSTYGFLGLLNQVLAFVTFFSQVKKNILGLCCCFTKAL